MNIEDINLGDPPTGAGGDTMRTAFGKTNQNFGAAKQALEDEVQTREQLLATQRDQLIALIESVNGPLPSLRADFKARSFGSKNAAGLFLPCDYSDLFTLSAPSPKWVWNAQGQLVEVPAGQPAWDHDPITGEPLGQRVEGAATNYIPASDMSVSPWGIPANRVSVTPVSGFIGPSIPCFEIAITSEGVLSASRVQVSVTLPAGDIIISFIAKPGTTSEARINMYAFPDEDLNGACSFFLDTQTATPTNPVVLDSGIEDAGEGRSLCWFKVSSASGGTGNIGFYPDSSAEGNSFLVGAPQVASGWSSYIPTNGSAITRAADVVTIENMDAAEWFDGSEFTLSWRVSVPFTPVPKSGDPSQSPRLAFSDGTNANRIQLDGQFSTTDPVRVVALVQIAGSTVFLGQGGHPWVPGVAKEIELRYGPTGAILKEDGVTIASFSGTLPPVPGIDRAYIGRRSDGVSATGALHVEDTVFSKTADLSELTS